MLAAESEVALLRRILQRRGWRGAPEGSYHEGSLEATGSGAAAQPGTRSPGTDVVEPSRPPRSPCGMEIKNPFSPFQLEGLNGLNPLTLPLFDGKQYRIEDCERADAMHCSL